MSAKIFHRDLSLIPNYSFTFVEEYIKLGSKASSEKRMSKGFKYYSESYVFDLKVAASSEEETVVTARCHRSQRKNDTPHSIKVFFKRNPPAVENATCNCAIGKSARCGHVCGVLYQLGKYKMLGLKVIPEDIVKTSLPQEWHKPRGEQIQPAEVQSLVIQSYNRSTCNRADEEPKCIKSTLYNPTEGNSPNLEHLVDELENFAPECQILPALKNVVSEYTPTRFGKFPKGSALSYQQKVTSDYIYNIVCPFEPPKLPVRCVMVNNYCIALDLETSIKLEDVMLSLKVIHRFEEQTRLQSASPLWHKIRRNRITASKVGKIFKRVRADPVKLAETLKQKSVQTEAMKQGIVHEPVAASSYANTVKQGNVNIYPSGVVISVKAPWIAASPDRIVFDPTKNPPFGLLEIKTTTKSSVRELTYLGVNEAGKISLKRNHNHFYQVLTQLAVTGLDWCDFYVWSENDDHLETIFFDSVMWQNVKDRVDAFFFEYFI